LLVFCLGQLLVAASSAQTTREASYIAKDKPLRILSLGDVLTSGYSDGFGNYRHPLQAYLTWGGYSFKFVGSNATQVSNYQGSDMKQTFSPYQPNYEGSSDLRIDQISSDKPAGDDSSGLYPGLTHAIITDVPDVILVMLGTSDVNQAYDPGGPGYAGGTGFAADAAGRLDALIDRLYHAKSDVTVVISSVPPLANATKDALAISYNALIPQIVLAHRKLGQHVLYADMRSTVKPVDISPDGIHPSTAGYNKMAGVWYSAMTGQDPPELHIISIHFVGGGTPMSANETAGVVAAANWNDAVGASSQGISLVDNAGMADGACVSWLGSGGYNNSLPDTPGNNRMMRNYLDGFSTNNVTVSGLPETFTRNGYDVYVYANGATYGATRVYNYRIGSASVNLTDPPNSDTIGAFILGANSPGNYVKFTSLTKSSFTLSASPVSSTDPDLRAVINGIQIVAH